MTGGVLLACALTPLRARAQDQMDGMAGMRHSMPGALGIPMERAGSGTTWIPDAVPIPSWGGTAGSWMLMAHGVATLQYTGWDGPRGGDHFGSLNWAMFMASRDFLGGKIQPRVMLSLDAATAGDEGYPLLLQSGEIHDGLAIHDRQHPHDFWMEAAVMYEAELASSLGLLLYGGPSGEPALGPVAFMHRPSAIENPLAPLSHHWQDATHISFGVVTAGFFGPKWRLEGSAFNGHEPNEERWDFDKIELNSYSGRLTLNPSQGLSLTAGFGRLDEPEQLHPGEDMDRWAASILYSRAGGDSRWATSAIWGMNRHVEEDAKATHAALLETSLTVGGNTMLGRAEFVEKSAEELVLPPSAGIRPDAVFGVGSFSLGYVRDLVDLGGFSVALGGVGTMSLISDKLKPIYGSQNPRGGVVFLRARPVAVPVMSMMGMD